MMNITVLSVGPARFCCIGITLNERYLYHGRVSCTALARVYVVCVHLHAFEDYVEHGAPNS